MRISTPIHDALAQAADAVRVLDVPGDVGDPGTEDAPAPTVAEDAEQVVALAWAEAADRGHGSFGTGHLLLAMARAGGPEGALLAAAGVTLATAGAAMALVASSSVSEPVAPGRDEVPVAGSAVSEVLVAGAAHDGTVTASGLLTALLTRPWGQAAEMLAALGVDAGELSADVPDLPDRTEAAPPRPLPRDPSGLLSSAWRKPVEAEV